MMPSSPGFMKEYYQLNKDKIVSVAKLYLLGFAILSAASVFVVIYFFFFNIVIAILIGVLATVVLTAVLLGQTLVTGNYEHQRRKRVFGIPALSEFFHANDFALIRTNTELKYDTTEVAMTGKIKNFVVVVDIDDEDPMLVLFSFKIEKAILSKEQFNRFLILLSHYRAEFTLDDIVVKMEFSKIKSTSELKSRLESFAEMLISEGFTPKY
jgi:hypothetical protein